MSVVLAPWRKENGGIQSRQHKDDIRQILLLGLAASLIAMILQGCAISKNIVPVDSSKEIEKIYVRRNNRVLMEGLHPELINQLNDLGFETASYSSDLPRGAVHYMTYNANWSWDLAMYLSKFRATLYEDGRVLGEIDYDSTRAINHLGSTANKIRPLLQEMFANVKRRPKGAAYYTEPANAETTVSKAPSPRPAPEQSDYRPIARSTPPTADVVAPDVQPDSIRPRPEPLSIPWQSPHSSTVSY